MKPKGYPPPPDLQSDWPRGRGLENQEANKKQREEDGVSYRRQQLEKREGMKMKNIKSKDTGSEVPVKKRKAAVNDVGRRRAEDSENQEAGK